MRYYSVFSGIEAASVAWKPLGWEPLLFSEIDSFACAVLGERFPDVPNVGDMVDVRWKKEVKRHGKPDVVVGGSPCQSFSVAGNRNGLEGASGLMWEYVRCVREVMPDWVLWENVPGALSSSHGEDFRCLLEALDAFGYGLAWRVLDAQFFGVAQRRERVFLVGRLGDVEGPCEVLFEHESLRWDTPPSREKRQELAEGAGDRPSCAGFKYHQGSGAGNIGYVSEQSPTLTADYHNTAVCIQGDIARGAHMGQNGRGWSDDGSCYTLNTIDVPAVVSDSQGFTPICMGDDNARASIDTDLCGTLKVGGSSPLCATGRMAVRRLTPRECERLQGFPDDWTLVPYRGKAANECPDTPRYRAIGNSMAVPVMRWIGERIQEVEAGR